MSIPSQASDTSSEMENAVTKKEKLYIKEKNKKQAKQQRNLKQEPYLV